MFKCLTCHSPLPKQILNDKKPKCSFCSRTFFRQNGFLSFLLSEGFNTQYSEIEKDLAFLNDEDEANRVRFKRYFVSLLKNWRLGRDSFILCLGCGGGADVDELRKNGFDESYGVDIGRRSQWWEIHDRSPMHIFLADGKNLPFEDRYFDVVISLGVIEHIGAVGATAGLYQDYEKRRIQFIREALRIIKKDGRLLLACPNRTFPIDFQHNISRTKFLKHFAIKTGIAIHSPFNPFLLNYADVIKYARSISLDVEIFPLPVHKYLGLSFRNSPFLRPLVKVFRTYLALLDILPSFIRMSFVNPYMLCELSRKH